MAKYPEVVPSMCEIVFARGRPPPLPTPIAALPVFLCTLDDIETPLVLSLRPFDLTEGVVVR